MDPCCPVVGAVDHRAERVQRAPRISRSVPRHPLVVRTVEVELRGGHLPDEPPPCCRRGTDQVRQDVVHGPPGAERRRLPLVRREAVEVTGEAATLRMHGIPHGALVHGRTPSVGSRAEDRAAVAPGQAGDRRRTHRGGGCQQDHTPAAGGREAQTRILGSTPDKTERATTDDGV